MRTRYITERAENRWSLSGQIMASVPAWVGAVMRAGAVGVLTSLLLEDAAVSTVSSVEFCCDGDGAVSALPLADWLRFLWAVWRSVMVLGNVGVRWAVSGLGLSWKNEIMGKRGAILFTFPFSCFCVINFYLYTPPEHQLKFNFSIH